MKNVTMITTFIYRGREFYILRDDNGIWGIESKYFNESGRLTITVNGLTGNLSKTIPECIRYIKSHVDIEYMVENEGLTLMDAIKAYYMRKEVAQ